MGEQPPKSISVSTQSLFNGGGATTLTFAGELKIMNSGRFLMELLSTILKSASRVIRVGEFRLLGDPAV